MSARLGAWRRARQASRQSGVVRRRGVELGQHPVRRDAEPLQQPPGPVIVARERAAQQVLDLDLTSAPRRRAQFAVSREHRPDVHLPAPPSPAAPASARAARRASSSSQRRSRVSAAAARWSPLRRMPEHDVHRRQLGRPERARLLARVLEHEPHLGRRRQPLRPPALRLARSLKRRCAAWREIPIARATSP